jgi:hypothetical protein
MNDFTRRAGAQEIKNRGGYIAFQQNELAGRGLTLRLSAPLLAA